MERKIKTLVKTTKSQHMFWKSFSRIRIGNQNPFYFFFRQFLFVLCLVSVLLLMNEWFKLHLICSKKNYMIYLNSSLHLYRTSTTSWFQILAYPCRYTQGRRMEHKLEIFQRKNESERSILKYKIHLPSLFPVSVLIRNSCFISSIFISCTTNYSHSHSNVSHFLLALL